MVNSWNITSWLWHFNEKFQFTYFKKVILKKLTERNEIKLSIIRCDPQSRSLLWDLKVIPQWCIAHPYCVRNCVICARFQNLQDFPQSKLDSEVNAPFLLSKHGDLYFSLHNNIVHITFFNFLKMFKKIVGRKKRYSRRRSQNRYSKMQTMTRKTTTLRTLYVHVVLNGVICPQVLYDIVLYARHFLLVKFLPRCYCNKVCFELPQNVRWNDK